MSTPQQPLIPGQYYHVFNKSVGGEFLFKNNENYRYFMEKYQKYISPFADTLAYCLMPTHFHFLIKPREKPGQEQSTEGSKPLLGKVYEGSKPLLGKVYEGSKTLVDLARQAGSKPPIDLAEPPGFDLSRKFSHLFNCYAQAYNKQNHRVGSLFKNRFKRVLITSDNHLRNAIIYIHLNPSHHKIEPDFKNWKFSSYEAIASTGETFIDRKTVLEIFDGLDNFIYCHNHKYELNQDFEKD